MRQPRLEYHPLRMWTSVVLGLAYGSSFLFAYTITGSTTLDGIIGVLLGLYISSHPAARLLDLLYLHSRTRHDLLSSEAGMSWLTVIVLVLATGLFTIIIATNRFVQPAATPVG